MSIIEKTPPEVAKFPEFAKFKKAKVIKVYKFNDTNEFDRDLVQKEHSKKIK